MAKGLADLQRRVEAGDPEAIDAVRRMYAAFGKAMTDWLESVRPALERLVAVVNQPEVRACLKQREGAFDGTGRVPESPA